MRTHRILDLVTPPVVLGVTRRIIRAARTPWVKHQLEGQTKLHLACGHNILDGWANIDCASTAHTIDWDITDGLPARSGSIELIYCEHFIEHVTPTQATDFLAECHRVLRSDGTLRLSTPSLSTLLDEYLAGRTSAWCDVGWSPDTPCQMVNQGLRLWGHQFVYDAPELTRVLEATGYRDITRVAWHESRIPELRNLECRPYHGEIIVEAVK